MNTNFFTFLKLTIRFQFVFLFASTIFSFDGYCQGALAITPISAYTYDSQSILKTAIQNLTDKILKFEFVPECDVDGKTLVGANCEKYFKFSCDAEFKSGVYEIAPKERATLAVSLISSVGTYGLFKPLVRPIMTTAKPTSGVSFEFNYRPGFLFLIHPADEKLASPNFSTRSSTAAKIAAFKFDIKNLKSPHVTNLSAKLMDSSTKKLIKFARLAEDKIVDPKRESLDLEVEYANLQDPDIPLCYELFIQDKAEGSKLEKLTNCKN